METQRPNTPTSSSPAQEPGSPQGVQIYDRPASADRKISPMMIALPLLLLVLIAIIAMWVV